MKIFRDASIYVIGEMLAKAFPFFLLPYLTRRLGAEEYGELALALMWMSIITMIVGMSQQSAIVRYFFQRGNHYLNLMVVVGHLIALVLTLPLIIAGVFLASPQLLTVALAALFQSYLSVQLSLRQCRKRPLAFVFIQLVYTSGSLGLTVLIFEIIQASAFNRVLSIALVNVIVVIMGFILVRKDLEWSTFERVTIRKSVVAGRYLLRYGIPLIPHQFSFFVRGQLDRMFIYSFFSAQSLGVYAAGYQVASIYLVLLGALNSALLPYFYEALKSGRLGYVKVWNIFRLSFVTVPVAAVVAFLIPVSVFQFFLGDSFGGAKNITCVFLLGMGMQIPYLLLVNYMFFHGLNKSVSKCTIGASVIYILSVYGFANVSLHAVPFSLLVSNIMLIVFLVREFRLFGRTNEYS